MNKAKRMPTNCTSNSSVYERGGFTFLMPSFLKVKSHIPSFFAQSKSPVAHVMIEVTRDVRTKSSWEKLLRGPISGHEQIAVGAIRQGPISSPYVGFERLAEYRVLVGADVPGHSRINFGWGLSLNMGEDTVNVDISDFRPYSPEAEQFWRKMIDSFRRMTPEEIRRVEEQDVASPHMDVPETNRRRRNSRRAKGPALPKRLSYLQPVFDAFNSLPPEELNEDVDTTPLENALRQRIQGLTFEKAEQRIETDAKTLMQWLEGAGAGSPPGYFISTWLSPFIVAELLEGG